MNKNLLLKVLIGLLAVSAVIMSVLAVIYVRGAGEIRRLQFQANQIAAQQNTIRALSADAIEYSKSHPDIDPILQAVGLKQPSGSPTKNGK